MDLLVVERGVLASLKVRGILESEDRMLEGQDVECMAGVVGCLWKMAVHL